MYLETTSICNVRKIINADLELAPISNVIVGANGSGKTTFLEALYLLSGGRSFRTARAKEIIHHNADKLTVTGNLKAGDKTLFLGIEKTKSSTRLRLNNENVSSASIVVRQTPMLVLNTESFRLLEGGPSNRRDLIDRLLFHVEPDYLGKLRKFYQVLKQRNACLRKGLSEKEITLWNEPLCEAGLIIDELRAQQVESLNDALVATGIEKNIGALKIIYERGWKKELALEEAVKGSLGRDKILGTTSNGPHRAELKIVVEDRAAKSSLSRGQIKLVVTALIVAMSHSISHIAGRAPILLVDDLSSELDNATKSKSIQLLMGLKTQAFFTAIEYNLLEELSDFNPAVFHVEQGRLKGMHH